MATNKNFEIKNGLSVAGTERISAAGVLTGSLASGVTATTQSATDNSTKLATTAYTDAAITAVIGGAPGTLDTLNELAAAIADDASYASTLTTALATKLPLSGGTLTGALSGTTAAFNAGATNVVATFTSTDGYAAIKLADNGGNVELTAVGNDFHIQNAGGAAHMIVQNTGRIVIGNNLPIWSGSYGGGLFLKGNNATSDRYAQLAIVDSNGAIAQAGLKVNNNGSVTVGGAGNVIITDGDLQVASGHGIDFSATGNGSGSMSSERLDDYEEGTWTPVVKLGSTTVTSSNSGFYTKIGRIITLQVTCAFSNLNSGTGNLTITGLPFGSANVNHRNHGSVGYFNVATSFGENGVQARISRNSSFIDFMRSHEISPAQHQHVASNTELYVTITYKNE